MSPLPGVPSVPLSRAGAILTVDLGAIVANWRDLCGQAPKATPAAVLKADAYGLGAVPVGRALYAAGCRTFFVAHIEEGFTLRAAFPDVRIFVLHGTFPHTEADCAAHGLIPVLSCREQVDGWIAFNRSRDIPAPSALQVDTGMTRLGLNRTDAENLRNDPDRYSALNPCLVMSHFACADEPNNPMNAQQLASFAALRRIFGDLPASLAQSPGIFLGPDAHYDLVRPGIAMYGANPVPGRENPMRQVLRLSARIIQLQDVDSPQAVGYGASHRITEPGRIATVSLGYADGFLRRIGFHHGGETVCGTVADRYKAPLIGRISMDLAAYDVSQVPADLLHHGGTIDVIGRFATIDDLANAGQTIPYEILTRLGSRFHRIYTNGADT